MKQCIRCNTLKPLSAYQKHPTGRDGTRGQCRLCRQEIGRQYYHAHKGAPKARLPKLPRYVPPHHYPISKRQRQIIGYVAQGYTSKGIGLRLGLSKRTIDNHIYSATKRLRLGTRIELAVWWTRQEGQIE